MLNNNLTEAPIKGLVWKMAAPVAVGFFFHTMYNVVDTYFGGQISTEALAALSLAFPVFFLIIIFTSGISTGATALLANVIGEGKTEKVKNYIGQIISFGIIMSVALTILGLYLSPAIFRLMGAEGEYLSIALSYMNVIFYGSVFFMMLSAINSILQASGNTIVFRNFLIGGFFLNCLLDPWFLYGGFGLPAMGFPGIALATIMVEFLGCIYIFLEAKKRGLITRETLQHLKPQWEPIREIVRQALPASLNLATIGIGIFVITYFISGFGQSAVAAYGIATRIEQIILLPIIGITVAALSIVGQNNGAKRPDRVREAYRLCMRYATTIMIAGALVMFFVRKPLMSFFTKDTQVVEIGSHYLAIAAFISVAYALLSIPVSTLQGIKRPMYAVWIGLYRQILAPVAIFYIFVKVLGFGIDAVWWGIFGVTWSAAIFTVIYTESVLIRKHIIE